LKEGAIILPAEKWQKLASPCSIIRNHIITIVRLEKAKRKVAKPQIFVYQGDKQRKRAPYNSIITRLM
jgi:hypothetical protein